MPGNDADRPIRLLHLSDIHFRTGTTWDSDPVLRDLTRFVAGEVAAGLVPDLVALTGDLAFSGTAEEYELARQWVEQKLWPVLSPSSSDPLPRDRLLLVPGNHDANWDTVDFVAEATQTALLSRRDQDQIAKVLSGTAQREVLLRRHAAYLDFYGAWLGATQPLPWWQRLVEIRGTRLHIAGLDSAWMACGDQDRGKLLLGRFQIHQTVVSEEAEGADWRIALLHHPWEYLAEFDCGESRQKVHLHRDLLLRGRLHEGEACFVRPPDPGRACLELAAGCVYEGSSYPNAFQWIELESGSNGNPKSARVHFRRWVQGNWQVDRNQPGCAEGTAELDLSEAEARSPATAGSTTSAGRRPSPKLNAVIMAAGAGLLFGSLALEAL